MIHFLNIAHKIIKNYIIIFLKLFGEKKFVYLVKVFPASIKSINPIQKYPQIIESYACILKIFVVSRSGGRRTMIKND